MKRNTQPSTKYLASVVGVPSFNTMGLQRCPRGADALASFSCEHTDRLISWIFPEVTFS